MANRQSFLDSPSYRSITTPSQRRAITERRRSSGFRGGGGSSDPIRRETKAERQKRERQAALKKLQTDVRESGGRFTQADADAILSGTDVSTIRQRIRKRQTREGFARLQRDLSRQGVSFTASETRMIVEGDSPSRVRESVESRLGREFASSRTGGFVSRRGFDVPVSQGVAELIRERESEGGFRTSQQQDTSARFSNAGGVSLASGGSAVVTPSGDFFGPVSLQPNLSTAQGPVRVTKTGDFVLSDREGRLRAQTTPSGDTLLLSRQTAPPPRISAPSRSSRTVQAARALARQPGTTFTEAQAAQFASGLETGFTQNPFRTADQLFGFTQSGRQEIAGTSRTRAQAAQFTTGLGVGTVGQVAGLKLLGRTIGFAGQAIKPFAQRTATGLGLRTTASRTAAAAVAAPVAGAALFAPAFVSATRRGASTDTLGRELTLQTLRTGGDIALVGRGATRPGVIRAGRRAGETLDANVPRFGSPSQLSRTSPFSAAQLQVTRAMPRPSTPLFGGMTARTTSVRPINFVTSAGGFPTPGGLTQQQLRFSRVPASTQRRRGPVRWIPSDSSSLIAQSQGGLINEFAAQQGFTRGSISQFGRTRPSPETISRQELRRILSAQTRGERGGGLPSTLDGGSRTRESFIDSFGLPAVRDTGTSRSLSEFSGFNVLTRPRRVSRVSPNEPGLSQFGIRRLRTSSGRSFVRLQDKRGTGTPDDVLQAIGSFGRRPRNVNLINRNFWDRQATGRLSSITRQRPRTSGRISSLNRWVNSRFSNTPTRRQSLTPSRSTSVSFGIGIIGGVATASRSRSLSRPDFGLDVNNALSQNFGQATDSGFRFDTFTGPRFGQATSQVTDLETTQDTSLIRVPGFRTPPDRVKNPPPYRRTPPPPPRIKVPFTGLPSIPDFGFSPIRRGRGRGSARQEQFTPSLVAQAFNIQGDRPSNGLTGLEIRPITFNFR